MDGYRRPLRLAGALVVAASLMLVTPPAHSDSGLSGGPMMGAVRPSDGTTTRSGRAPAFLTWHGGPVMHSSKVHALFWNAPGSSFTQEYVDGVNQYFHDVAKASGSKGNAYSVMTQYTDATGKAAYKVKQGKSWFLNQEYPTGGCVPAPCITDTQMRAELNGIIPVLRTLPENDPAETGLKDLYFVFLPAGVKTCFGADCSLVVFCAYHSWFTGFEGKDILYANMPFLYGTAGCDPFQYPGSGSTAHSILNATSHEHIEAITDPNGAGWYDTDFSGEISDICNFEFGTPIGGTSGAFYNNKISGHPYNLQLEYSNLSSACLRKGH